MLQEEHISAINRKIADGKILLASTMADLAGISIEGPSNKLFAEILGCASQVDYLVCSEVFSCYAGIVDSFTKDERALLATPAVSAVYARASQMEGHITALTDPMGRTESRIALPLNYGDESHPSRLAVVFRHHVRGVPVLEVFYPASGPQKYVRDVPMVDWERGTPIIIRGVDDVSAVVSAIAPAQQRFFQAPAHAPVALSS